MRCVKLLLVVALASSLLTLTGRATSQSVESSEAAIVNAADFAGFEWKENPWASGIDASDQLPSVVAREVEELRVRGTAAASRPDLSALDLQDQQTLSIAPSFGPYANEYTESWDADDAYLGRAMRAMSRAPRIADSATSQPVASSPGCTPLFQNGVTAYMQTGPDKLVEAGSDGLASGAAPRSASDYCIPESTRAEKAGTENALRTGGARPLDNPAAGLNGPAE